MGQCVFACFAVKFALCLNLDSLDLRINLIGGKDVEKSGKSGGGQCCN